MAINLTSYPVETVSGIIQNAFAGFKPITLTFQRTASEIAVECVLVDPDDSEIDLLGFSLYADFDLSGNAVIDVSIINDKNSQAPILTSQENTDSRIKYRVKYREAGTENVYLTISEEPIIAVYSIEQFDLDKWLTPVIEPNLWLGYPNMSGFVHSDANDIGLDLVVRYDLLDIQKNVISAGNDLSNYGALPYGSLITDINARSQGVFPVLNGGGTGTTDWIGQGNQPNLAEYWELTFGTGSFSRVSGNGFIGSAQQAICVGSFITIGSTVVYDIDPLKQYYIRFKQRSTGTSRVQLSVGVTVSIPSNEGDASSFEVAIPLGNSLFRAAFQCYTNANWLQIDEVEIYTNDVDPIIGVAYIDYKIITE